MSSVGWHFTLAKDTWVAHEPDVSAGRRCAHSIHPRAGLHRRELGYGVVVTSVELAIRMAHVLARQIAQQLHKLKVLHGLSLIRI